MDRVTLGIDVACRAEHRATLADERGAYVWQGRRLRTTTEQLEALWEQVPDEAEVTVVMEPTRNAWVPLAAWFRARGAHVVVVPPEQAADLRAYYHKHTKNDRLDSRVLARLPLLHPEGLRDLDNLGPADALKRAVRQRASLVERRSSCFQRLDALLELLGPAWTDALGAGDYPKTALAVLARYADPRRLRRLGRARLTQFLRKHSRGAWGEQAADRLLAAADEALVLWADGGLDFDELACDIASEVRAVQALNDEIATLDARIEALYADADPGRIFASAPQIATTSAADILGRLGDPNRFANLAGTRAFTGLVPGTDQSGDAEAHTGLTKAGDPGLRQALFLAADRARHVDPTLAAKYYRLVVHAGKHHTSAVCHLAATLVTRLAACWRNGERYIIRDVDGRELTEAEGRAIVADRYHIPPEVRRKRRRTTTAKQHKQRTGRREQKSTETAASAHDPPADQPTQQVQPA